MNSQQLRARLLSTGLATSDGISGCTAKELEQIKLAAGVPLPDDYLGFMSQFGKKAGRFLRDIEVFFPAVLSLRPLAVELLEDCNGGSLTLPRDAFVFGMRNKEQFMFISSTEGKSAIMHYMAGDASFSKVANSFWELVENELDLAEYSYRQVKGTPYDLRPEQ